jgi:molybdopterin converting factor small subunit
MARGFTREQLDEKTVPELRGIAKNLGCVGYSKKAKTIVIDLIMEKQDPAAVSEVAKAKPEADPVKKDDKLNQVEFNLQSVLTKPSAKFGDKTTTTIRVSCGAAAGDFSVCGKTVGAVSEFLREVLNIDRMAQGVVNGKTVDGSYLLKDGDNLEFLKAAGRKG